MAKIFIKISKRAPNSKVKALGKYVGVHRDARVKYLQTKHSFFDRY